MSDKRRGLRFTVERIQGRMVYTCPVEIANMSLGGAALKLEKALRVGDEYALKLEGDGKVVSLKGDIAWCVLSETRKVGGGDTVSVYSAGMRFRGVLSEGAEGLLEFIDKHKIVPEHRLGGVRVYVEGPALLDLPEAYAVRVISRSGMLVETAHPLSVDEVHPMEISIRRGRAIRFSGRVASCTERLDRTPKHYDAGIEFREMSRDDGTRLGRLIKTLSLGARGRRRPAG